MNGSNREFASTAYKTKGCFGYIRGLPNEWQNEYVDYIYYGIGGSKEQIRYGLSSSEYRPPGFDCRYDGNVISIFQLLINYSSNKLRHLNMILFIQTDTLYLLVIISNEGNDKALTSISDTGEFFINIPNCTCKSFYAEFHIHT